MRYSANLTAGSLKLRESRVIADLLLQDLDADAWRSALYDDNRLQLGSRKTIAHMDQLLAGRLRLMTADLWRLVRDGDGTLSAQACLAATIKRSRLLGDFLDLVVREQYRIFAPALSHGLFHDYIASCRDRAPDTPVWSDATVARLRSSVFQILAQAGYIENTRTLALQSVHLAPQLLDYLRAHNERYVLRCMQVGS